MQYALAALRPIRGGSTPAGAAPSLPPPLTRQADSGAAAQAPQELAAGGLSGQQWGRSAGMAPGAWSAASGSGSYEETTYLRFTRTQSPPPPPGSPLGAGVLERPPPRPSAHGNNHATLSCVAMQPAPTQPAPPLLGTASMAGAGAAHRSTPQSPVPGRNLAIQVLGCSELRVADPAAARPYVTLSQPGGGGSGAGRGWRHETRPGRGSSPRFDDAAPALVPAPTAAGAGAVLEVVVFDAAQAGGGLVGAARVPLPAGERGSDVAAAASGAAQSVPLVHPATGRHAGTLELQLAWAN